MSKEIERKFLVNMIAFYNYINLDKNNIIKTDLIEQTYYNNPDFRIRKKTPLPEGTSSFFFTVKQGMGIERNEIELEIDQFIGNYLLKNNKILSKHRFTTKDGWEVDHFLYTDLWIAEKELKNINENILLPLFVTEEITEKIEYSNYELWRKIK